MKVRTATPCRAMRDPRTWTHRRDARVLTHKGKVTRGGKVLPCLASIGTCWKRKKAHADSGEAGHRTAKAVAREAVGGAKAQRHVDTQRTTTDESDSENHFCLVKAQRPTRADTHAAQRWRDEEVAVPEGAAQGGTATDDPEAKARRTEAGG
ncbi:hypothetical protein ERJ75_001143100 [Trypanosoma vivax]|nr:hypothetical protein ERJ75_001143100 [Trypanosoma vivax]